MPRNGNGDYDLPAGNPVVPGTVIESDWANNTMNDLAAALTDSISADGQTDPLNNLPMAGFHHTGVSDPTLRNQYASLGMVQDGRHARVQITGGVDNLTGTLVGGSTAYTAGAFISFFAPATNTGAMTMNYNAIGPRSIVGDNGLPLVAGDIRAGDFYVAIYNGTSFELLSTTSNTSSNLFQTSTTGWIRPLGGTYPVLTIATGTTINVPAGQGYIIPPGNTGNENATLVSWDAQTITLQYVSTSFSTTVTVDQNGTIVQYQGQVIGAAIRTHAVIGVVQHFNGIASTVTTQPSVFGDDGYLTRATATLLNGLIVSGCKVSGNGSALLAMNVSEGVIFVPGASSQNPDSPNTISVPQQNQLQFKTLAGEATIGGTVLTNAPVTQYDPAGSGVVTTIPANNDVVIHRLYYLYGQFIWVFGQYLYTSLDNALINIEVDRSKRITSTRLAGATLLAEIATNKANTSLSNASTAILVKGSQYFSIGSPGGIGEAPVDGNAYGREDATWVPVLKGINPQLTGTVTLTGSNPKTVQVASPVIAGYMGFQSKQLAFDWCNLEITYPDDKTYFRSYNPANGNLRNSTEWDLATGNWLFPANVQALTFNGKTLPAGNIGDVIGPASATDNGVVLFDGTTGKLIKSGAVLGDAAFATKQTSPTDPTAGRLLLVGATKEALGSNVMGTAGGTFDGPTAQPYGMEKIQAAAGVTVDVTAGAYITATAAGPNTWTFNVTPTAGYATSWTFELTNGGIAAQSFPNVKWAGGTPPTLTASGVDVLVFTRANGITRGYQAAEDSK